MNKDTIVGVVGAVILLAAMVGVFKYEGSQAQSSLGGRAFDLTWASAKANGPTVSEGTALGSATTVNLSVAQTNLTRAEFTVSWQAQNGRDTLNVTVTPPAGSGLAARSVESDEGRVTLAFDVPNTTPPAATVFGNDEPDARARLAAQHTKRAGTGEWTLTVEFTEASGVVTLPGGPPVLRDESVAWRAETLYTHYSPVLRAR